MVTFKDGPAAEQVLALRAAPPFLRVVVNGGKWDGLDQPSDAPTPAETIYAYERIGPARMVHIRGGKHGSGYYAYAEYQLFPWQPTDQIMRDSIAWFEWCAKREVPNG